MRILLIIAIFLLRAVALFPQQTFPADSIRQILKVMPEPARLVYLKEQIEQTFQQSVSMEYARLLETEALRQEKEEYLADAWFVYATRYYANNIDSLAYWVNKAEPLYIKIGRFEDLCRMVGWLAYDYTRAGNQEKTIETIERLRRLSNKLPFPEGLEMADQAMADLYFSNKQYDVGEELYLTVLDKMEKRNAPEVKRLNILRRLFYRLPASKERLEYLRKAEELINQCKASGITILTDGSSVSSWEYAIQYYSAREYIDERDFPETWKYLRKAQELADSLQLSTAENALSQLYMLYYRGVGDYIKALIYADRLEEVYRSKHSLSPLYEVLKTKAYIFARQNKREATLAAYEEMLALKDSINQESFNAQLADLRTRYEVDKLEMEKEQVEDNARHSRLQVTLLIAGCVVLLSILLLLSYQFSLAQRSKKVMQLAKEKAEEADRMKSAFLANMNHEIRTPLNAIVGFSQILAEEEDAENRREFVEIIQSNNELLQQLIGDVLDISKIESNTIQLIYKVHDLPVLMKEIYSTISLRMQKEIEFILDPCEPSQLETDRNRLTQVLTNLLTNAIKYTNKGHIRFGYELKGDEVLFYVEDTGTGIEKEYLEDIFNRFVQLKNGKKGAGLGLAICKGLVTKMEGKMWVTSTVGTGSVFYVQIPLHNPDNNTEHQIL